MKKIIIGISSTLLLCVTAILGIVVGVNHSNNGRTDLGNLENTDSVIFNDLEENGIRLRQNKITQSGSSATITAEIYPASAIKPELEWEFSTASGKKWKTEADDLIPGMDSYPTISADTLTIEFYMYGYWTETITLKCWVKDNPEICASINLECVGRDVTAKKFDKVTIPASYSIETITMSQLLALLPTEWYNEKTTGGTIQGNAFISNTPEYVEYMTYSWTEDPSGGEEVYVYDCQTQGWSVVKDMTIKQFVQEYIQTTDCPSLDTYEEALRYFCGKEADGCHINLYFVYQCGAEYEGLKYYEDFGGNTYVGLKSDFDFSNLLNVQSINLGGTTLIF